VVRIGENLRLLAVALLLLLGLPSCGGRVGTELPDFVLITMDTTRADHLGVYGYFRDTSPAIDRFSRECIVFDQCIVPMAVTLPSHVSMLTSTYPMEHGVLANVQHGGRYFVPTPSLRTFASVCRERGYDTAAFVSAVPVKRKTGIGDGFDQFDEPERGGRTAGATTDAVIDWLEKRGVDEESGPYFLWVHYFDPHQPLRPPEPFDRWFEADEGLDEYLREREWPDVVPGVSEGTYPDLPSALNAYDGEIRYMDEQIGRLLESLRRAPGWEETLVLLVGDHGESLSQHGEPAHNGVWHEQVRVPLMMRVPGEGARREAILISGVDLFPTLLGFVPGGAFDAFLEQASGWDVFAGSGRERFLLSQDTGQKMGEAGYRYSLTTERWKYIWFPGGDGDEDRLYDLAEDPFELRDLSGERAEIVGVLRDSLRAQVALWAERGRGLHEEGAPTEIPVDSITLEELKALGYAVD